MDTALLFRYAEQINAPSISGKWRVVRVCPDPVTDEWFNVGVLFKAKRRPPEAMFLDNLSAFRCLYGDQATENMTQLLKAAEYLVTKHTNAPMGGHIRLGPELYTSGESVEGILGSLFSTFVTLGRPNQPLVVVKDNIDGVSSSDLIRDVISRASRRNPQACNRYFHRNPVKLTDEETKLKRDFELQIFAQTELAGSGPRFGAICSAFIRTDINRGYGLNHASVNLLNAKDILSRNSKPKGGFFILRPKDGASGFSENLLSKIDEEIDRAVFHFKRDKSFSVEVCDTTDELAEAAMDFAWPPGFA